MPSTVSMSINHIASLDELALWSHLSLIYIRVLKWFRRSVYNKVFMTQINLTHKYGVDISSMY